jgi:insulin-like growth factor 2 mRNA-binding protein 1
MYRVYLGNLDEQVTEPILQKVFSDNGLPVTGILIKRGYGFVDCPDQTTFDQTIDRLNGYNLMGSVMQVEPSTVSKRRKSNRIQIRNFPSTTTKDDVQQLVASFGTVQKYDLVSNSMETYVTVVYESPEEAQQAIEQLNNYDYQGSVLRAEFTNSGISQRYNRASGRDFQNSDTRDAGYTLRIFVPSEYVGAIIGKKGQTIRNITKESEVSRIDVHGKDNSSLIEKVISITGLPEHVTSACKEILKVMHQEASANNAGEVMLKILADDRYCGRIIGKEGKVIKKIREDTDTHIVVSNTQEMTAIFPDRVIAVRGTVENMSLAEAAISELLRECVDKDVRLMSGSGSSSMAMLPPTGTGFYTAAFRQPFGMPNPALGFGPTPPTFYPKVHGSLSQSRMSPHANNEVYQISVPSAAIGAIIGSGGANIKQIIRDSGAFVTIDPKKDVAAEASPSSDRIVTVKGNPEACWKASYFVFEKMKIEGFAGYDDVRLKTAIKVPRSIVGRIIGKGGKTVREIQNSTGVIVKLLANAGDQSDADDVLVDVYGTFASTQAAYSRIRSIISHSRQQQQQQQVSPPGGDADDCSQLGAVSTQVQ